MVSIHTLYFYSQTQHLVVVAVAIGQALRPCISDLGSSAHDLGAFFVVGILSHPATRMRSGSKINNTCHPHATVPECCAQADLPVRCTRRRTRVPPFLMRPAIFWILLVSDAVRIFRTPATPTPSSSLLRTCRRPLVRVLSPLQLHVPTA